MENLDKIIVVTDDKGNKVEGEIIFTFEANGEDFVLYELNDEAFAAKVDEDGNMTPVQEDEWKLVEKIYNEYLEDLDEDDEEEEND